MPTANLILHYCRMRDEFNHASKQGRRNLRTIVKPSPQMHSSETLEGSGTAVNETSSMKTCDEAPPTAPVTALKPTKSDEALVGAKKLCEYCTYPADGAMVMNCGEPCRMLPLEFRNAT